MTLMIKRPSIMRRKGGRGSEGRRDGTYSDEKGVVRDEKSFVINMSVGDKDDDGERVL